MFVFKNKGIFFLQFVKRFGGIIGVLIGSSLEHMLNIVGASIVLLAIMEVGIGICLLMNLWRKQTIIVALFHMAVTFTPLLLFPSESFQEPPLVPTLLGQYIGKNFVIVAALLSLMRERPLATTIIKNKS